VGSATPVPHRLVSSTRYAPSPWVIPRVTVGPVTALIASDDRVAPRDGWFLALA
jgi:hypothetical protein